MINVRDIPAYLVFLVMIAGCGSSSEFDSLRSARTISYQIGVPNFDLEALVLWRDGKSGANLNLNIPFVSLSFVKSERGYTSVFSITVQAVDLESERIATEDQWTDTVDVKAYTSTESAHPRILTRWMEIPPGEYALKVILEDQNSSKEAMRSQVIRVPAVNRGEVSMSSLWIESLGSDSVFRPLVALHIPASVESLHATAIIYNLDAIGPAFAHTTLSRIRSDTSIASPPYTFSPMKGTFEYQGLDYQNRDTIDRGLVRLPHAAEAFTFRYPLPSLEKGIYLFREEVVGSDDEGGPGTIAREHEISIKGNTFPQPSTLDELVQPLVYLTSKDNMEAFSSASTRDEKRKLFEAFWLKLGRGKEGAAELIKRYYTRVQEANLLFTNFKEGWKTDRGMIYVVLGPPISVEHGIDMEIWHYGYNEGDPQSSFSFERVRGYVPDTLFPNYVLRREPYYEYPWRKAIERWHSGFVQ